MWEVQMKKMLVLHHEIHRPLLFLAHSLGEVVVRLEG
jgi:hypothetical protein